jgi:hypothetical protein
VEGDVNSCEMTLRKQEDTGSWRRKLRIALFGQLSLEETKDVSQDRLLLDLNRQICTVKIFVPHELVKYLPDQKWRMLYSGIWLHVVCMNRRFGLIYRLHLQGREIRSYLLTLVFRSRIFLPWRWRQCVPPKRWFAQELHGSTSQKTASFIVIAVKTSNVTKIKMFRY